MESGELHQRDPPVIQSVANTAHTQQKGEIAKKRIFVRKRNFVIARSTSSTPRCVLLLVRPAQPAIQTCTTLSQPLQRSPELRCTFFAAAQLDRVRLALFSLVRPLS